MFIHICVDISVKKNKNDKRPWKKQLQKFGLLRNYSYNKTQSFSSTILS